MAGHLVPRLVTVLCIGACAVGFSVQVAKLSELFFRYETMTHIVTDILRHSYAPAIHICPMTIQVVNVTAYNEAHSSSPVKSITNVNDILAFQSKLTVEDLFKYSPSAMDMIEECMIRRPFMGGFQSYDRTFCNNLFDVTKYFTMENMCYMIRLLPLQHDIQYDTNHLGVALNFQGAYYSFVLTKKWDMLLNDFKILSLGRDGDLDKSLPVALLVSRGLYQGNSMYNRFSTRNMRVRYVRLPPPYQSWCRHYLRDGFKSNIGCANSCVQKRSLETFGKFWYGSQAYFPVPEIPISTNDFKNKTFGKQFEKIYTECHAACSQQECRITWSLTSVNQRKSGNSLQFTAVMSSQPSLTIEHESKLTLESYLIFIMSCVGSWFGLSVLSFDPLTIGRRMKRKFPPEGARGLNSENLRAIQKELLSMQKEVNGIKRILFLGLQLEPVRYMTPPRGRKPKL
ncbi:hypothetical protein HDE_01923 [Halotydeus destructor]|nr:hypothetical protein HDE_01923 [Halotydeus destructor]